MVELPQYTYARCCYTCDRGFWFSYVDDDEGVVYGVFCCADKSKSDIKDLEDKTVEEYHDHGPDVVLWDSVVQKELGLDEEDTNGIWDSFRWRKLYEYCNKYTEYKKVLLFT